MSTTWKFWTTYSSDSNTTTSKSTWPNASSATPKWPTWGLCSLLMVSDLARKSCPSYVKCPRPPTNGRCGLSLDSATFSATISRTSLSSLNPCIGLPGRTSTRRAPSTRRLSKRSTPSKMPSSPSRWWLSLGRTASLPSSRKPIRPLEPTKAASVPPCARLTIKARSTCSRTPPVNSKHTNSTTHRSCWKWPTPCSEWKRTTSTSGVDLSLSLWTSDPNRNCPTCTRKRWPDSPPCHWSTTLLSRTKRGPVCHCFSERPARLRSTPCRQPTLRCSGCKVRTPTSNCSTTSGSLRLGLGTSSPIIDFALKRSTRTCSSTTITWCGCSANRRAPKLHQRLPCICP